nr:cytochrome c biogenesis protein CcdA [Haloarcula salina]
MGTGVATFFSPCAYALLPGYVGYYLSGTDDSDDAPIRGAAIRGFAAFLGVALVFGALSLLVVAVGRSIRPILTLLEPVVGVALVAFGVAVVLGKGAGWHVALPERRLSVAGFVLFGAGYAVAAAGCVAPLFLAIVVKAVTFSPGDALLVMGAYTLGFGTLLLGATVAIAVGRRELFDLLGRHQRLLNTVAGVALVLAGVWQLLTTL